MQGKTFSVRACPQTKPWWWPILPPLLQIGVFLLPRADDRDSHKGWWSWSQYMILGEKTHFTWHVTKSLDFGLRLCLTCSPVVMNKPFHFSEFVSLPIKWKYNNRMKYTRRKSSSQGLWYSWQLISVLDLLFLHWECAISRLESGLSCVMEEMILHELPFLTWARAAPLSLCPPCARTAAPSLPFADVLFSRELRFYWLPWEKLVARV